MEWFQFVRQSQATDRVTVNNPRESLKWQTGKRWISANIPQKSDIDNILKQLIKMVWYEFPLVNVWQTISEEVIESRSGHTDWGW